MLIIKLNFLKKGRHDSVESTPVKRSNSTNVTTVNIFMKVEHQLIIFKWHLNKFQEDHNKILKKKFITFVMLIENISFT